MAKRDAFLLRIDPEILAALRRWADDDLRSLNAQIDFLLRRSLRETGRLPSGRPRTITGQAAPGEDR
ncbi:MAG: hypothetical protein H6R27_27 [Proteobacteria bacterium]|nr:hypothetical protein [Pseudomonadota bacterium]